MQTPAERLAAQPWRAGYADPLFARNRPRAYERDGGRCVRCGFEVSPRAYICDHVLPLSDGGTSEIENLQTLCAPCSKIKTRIDRRARAERQGR
jgi:5-methylcytosine-specific restriction endonuclease McrA